MQKTSLLKVQKIIVAAAVITIFLPSTWAEKSHQSPKRHISTSLTDAQKRSGFTSAKYATAYDLWGRSVMRRNHAVIEVAESNRDAEFGFYVILKKRHITGSEAKRLASDYYDEFVAMRERFFDETTARKCFVDIKDKDEQTVASADETEVRLGP